MLKNLLWVVLGASISIGITVFASQAILPKQSVAPLGYPRKLACPAGKHITAISQTDGCFANGCQIWVNSVACG